MKTDKELITSYLDEILPNVGCELIYNTDYELLIAVMLSAQTTDKAVNKVTTVLFSKYKTLSEFDEASLSDIEEIIQSIGLYKNKAKNLKGIVKLLISDYEGRVPNSRDELSTFPGVGHKTAGVVLAELFNQPEFPVDTHVCRISKRLSLAKRSDDVLLIEKKLKKAFPKENWIKLHHQFIHFGRYYCLAKNPKCKNCKLSEICNEKCSKN